MSLIFLSAAGAFFVALMDLFCQGFLAEGRGKPAQFKKKQKQIDKGLRPAPSPWEAEVKYILVLQWPATSEADFQALISMEDLLEEDLPDAHGFVDGHDFGAGEMNIFVHTDQPFDAFQDAMTSLGPDPRRASVRAAYRPADGDRYVVIWPNTLEVFSVS